MSLAAIRDVFLKQSIEVTAVSTLGCDLKCDGIGQRESDAGTFVASEGADPSLRSLDELPLREGELPRERAAGHLLILSGGLLNKLMPPLGAAFPFKAVVVLGGATDGPLAVTLQRSLFDRGLVGIGLIESAGSEGRCYLASDLVSSTKALGALNRGKVRMSTLGTKGRFGNQLFQYSFLKLYALRHGLIAEVPEWDGERLFNVSDPVSEGLLPELGFDRAKEDDLILWELESPPLDVDFRGYFQQTPECWRLHRPLLRSLFRLAPEHTNPIDAWRIEATEDGDRTLIAIHVRRGDYRKAQFRRRQYRLIPEAWYLAWLRDVWPKLRRPVLFVATDEPDAILPHFEEFSPLSAPQIGKVPAHVFDFEMLRCADLLAICNSTFSRMAAILAADSQKSFCPSISTERFESYEPWIEQRFWVHFDPQEVRGVRAIRESLIDKRLEIGQLRQKLSEKKRSNLIARQRVEKLRNQTKALQERSAALEKRLLSAKRRLDQMHRSRTWRATAPLRWLLSLIRGARD